MAWSKSGYVVALKEIVLRELNQTMDTRDSVAEQTTRGVARALARIRAAARQRHDGQDASVNATRAALRAPVAGVA